MKLKIIISLCLISFQNLQGQTISKTITGDKKKTVMVDELKIPAMILVWYDKFYDEHSINPCGIANIKKFGKTRTLAVARPQMFILPVGNQIPFLIIPGDTVTFYNPVQTASRDSRFPSLKHVSNKTRTEELKFFEKVFDSLGPCYGLNSYAVPNDIKTIQSALNYCTVKLNKRKNFLNSFFDKGEIQNSFFQYAKEYFTFKFYDDVLSMLQSKRFPDSSTKNFALKLSDSLVSSLNDDNGQYYYSWYDAIKNYIELKIDWGELNSERFDFLVHELSSNLKNKAKDFAIFYLYKLLMDKRPELIKSKIASLSNICSDRDYVSYISGNIIFTKKNTVGVKKERLLDVNNSKYELTSLINRFNGKVIYLDFWASWCLPCIEELPFSKNLINEFQGADVKFVFLSTDTYTDRWKRAITENGMLKSGVHYLIEDGEENFFVKKYNIEAIPRYILINKHGEVVNADAPRPSEEKTKELIYKLLKE